VFEAAPVRELGFAATKRDEVDVSQKCPPTCPGRGVRPRIRSIPHYNLSGAIGVGGRRRRAANRRFAVADADWESVGGAWTPESEGFAAEQVEIAVVTNRTEMGIGGWTERKRPRITESDTNCHDPWPPAIAVA